MQLFQNHPVSTQLPTLSTTNCSRISFVGVDVTYSLVHVNGVLAGDHVLDGGAAGLLLGRHFYNERNLD